MQTQLSPVERPASLFMKIAYMISRSMFGKVITPMKVLYSRLPLSFLTWSRGISKLDGKLSLDPQVALMVKVYVAQLNICTFCIDIAKMFAIKKQLNEEKFYHLQEYKESAIYSPAEKAALRFAEELTLHKAVGDKTHQEVAKYFTERQRVELAWLVATEHYYNIMNLAFNIHSDNLCDINMKKSAEKVVQY